MPECREPTPGVIAEAARRLRAGELVVFPTETVYGLGGDLRRVDTLLRIFALKGRPRDNPVIAHVAGAAQARLLVSGWDDRADTLARRFWPGPLTLVLPRSTSVPPEATGGRDTVAVRSPRHPVAIALLAAFDGPLAAPSANRSGHVSPTTAGHVAADFADERDLLILDGGPCVVGLESTVLDLTTTPARVLRPGSVTPDALREAIGDVVVHASSTQAASPGTAPRHYAPRTPARLVDGETLAAMLAEVDTPVVVLAFAGTKVPPPHRHLVMPEAAADYAAVLYDTLRRADRMGATLIVIETPPDATGMWLAIVDRLRRATTAE